MSDMGRTDQSDTYALPQKNRQDSVDPLVLEEWKELRGEIARKQGAVERLVLAAVGGNLAIMAFALKNATTEGILIALLPTVITSITHIWFLTYLYSGFRISRYIQDMIEPKMPVIGWEQWLMKHRAEHQLPIDPFKMICWILYLVSLGTAILKVFLLRSWSNEMMTIAWQSTVIVLGWTVWIALIHGIAVRRIRRRIKSLYIPFS